MHIRGALTLQVRQKGRAILYHDGAPVSQYLSGDGARDVRFLRLY